MADAVHPGARKPEAPTEYRSLLVFRIGYFGDALIALPALRYIRERHPHAHITLLTNDGENGRRVIAPDLVPADFVDHFECYPRLRHIRSAGAILSLGLKLRRRRFEAAIYLAPQIRTREQRLRDRMLFRLLTIRDVIGLDMESDPMHPQDVEWRYLMRRAGADQMEGRADDLRLTIEEHERARRWLLDQGIDGKRLVAIAPFSAMQAKSWPLERFATVAGALADQFGFHPIIVGGPADRDSADTLIRAAGIGTAATGSLPPRVLGAILGRCVMLVGVDSGPAHLAAAAGTRCVIVAASIAPPRIWDPVGSGHVILRASTQCDGCHLSRCANNNRCIRSISEADVIHAAASTLAQVP